MEEEAEKNLMKKKMLKRKLTLLFYHNILISLIFYGMLGTLGIMLYPKISLLLKSMFEAKQVVCNCGSVISFTSNPLLFGSYLALGVALLLFVYLQLQKITRIYFETRKYTHKILRNSIPLSQKIKIVAGNLNLTGKINEVDIEEPIVFCYGMKNPKICISSLIVRKLNDEELFAVLEHEKQHLLQNEPFKLFIIQFIVSSIGFMPGIKAITKQYKILCELLADYHATNGFTHKGPLARALYKVINLNNVSFTKKNLALSYFSAVIEERINILTSPENEPRIKNITLHFSYSFLSIVSLFIILYNIFLSAPQANANNSIGQCLEIMSRAEILCKAPANPSCDATYFFESPLCR